MDFTIVARSDSKFPRNLKSLASVTPYSSEDLVTLYEHGAWKTDELDDHALLYRVIEHETIHIVLETSLYLEDQSIRFDRIFNLWGPIAPSDYSLK